MRIPFSKYIPPPLFTEFMPPNVIPRPAADVWNTSIYIQPAGSTEGKVDTSASVPFPYTKPPESVALDPVT